MRYGVFSDVHGNYGALRVVLAKLAELKVDSYLCCGDLVGYGPQPDECVKEVAALPSLKCVIGNHDMAVLGRIPIEWFNSTAGEAIKFTQRILSPESRGFLAVCPRMIELKDITLVHGSPRNPVEEYLLTGEQFLENTDRWKTSVCFVGHSHVPLYMSRAGARFPLVIPLSAGDKIQLAAGARYIFNPGSVGQPRDRDSRASLAVFDSEKLVFELFRLEYPVAATQELMRRARLPELLIERIGNGW